MPPRIRTRASKALKENIDVTANKSKLAKNATKAPRKALADKTNSASDDASLEIPTKTKKTITKTSKTGPNKDGEQKQTVETKKLQQKRSVKTKENIEPVKSQNVGKVQEKMQLTARPTRLAKVNALRKETRDTSSDKSSPDTNNNAKGRMSRKKTSKTQPPAASASKKPSPVNKVESIRKFLTPMSRFSSLANQSQSSPIKKISPKKSTNNKKSDRNLSFKLLGSKKTSQESENNEPRDDIYEFTFDPNEEPKPQKKKRKRTVTKKPTPGPIAKPKKVYKSSYDQNISKALAALRNAVKPGKSTKAAKLTQIAEISDDEEENVQNNVANNENSVQTTNNMAFNDTGKNSVHECNYPSIRVEDIAADIEPSVDHHDDINYSPVNSPMPHGFKTPNAHASLNHRETPERSVHNNDPLNLLEELSFFDEQPIASSSMNVSVRHPLASPWRVEFGSLPIKWPNNAYIKANMTPAVETSFINPEDSSNKRKHVYTNMLPQNDEMFTDVVDTPNLKQPSIISFMKEMAEKSAKKKRGRSVSPTKAIYQGMVDVNSEANNKSAKKGSENIADTVAPPSNNTSEETRPPPPHHHSTPLRHHHHSPTSTDKENLKEGRQTRKRKNKENLCNIPAKSPRKQKDKDCTFFGFDESEDQDENISPVKINNNPIRGRSLRLRSKAVLQEINGPTRAVLPVAAKTKIVTSSEAVNKVYEGLKSGADAPVFPEKDVEDNVTNIEELDINDDSQSVHLFEDIEVIHHVKPTRKSYGKAKKVTFQQHSSSDSDAPEPVAANQNDSSDYDDLGDLTFEVPDVKEKKVTKKKKPKNLRSKKEEKEAEAWAANFNSMCEDIEEFPLLVE